MMSAKLATLGLLKMKAFWDKVHGVIVYVHDATKRILSHESNHIVNMVIL